VVKKDDKVLSYMELTHYWSGSAGGPEGWPVIVVNEYANIEDAMDQDNSALVEKAWPDEEERKAFLRNSMLTGAMVTTKTWKFVTIGVFTKIK
jgi:hypothetical protein